MAEGEGLNRYKNKFATHRAVTSIKSRHLRSVRAQSKQKRSRGMRRHSCRCVRPPRWRGSLKTLELTRLQGGTRPTSMGHGVPWAATVVIVNCRQKRGLTDSPGALRAPSAGGPIRVWVSKLPSFSFSITKIFFIIKILIMDLKFCIFYSYRCICQSFNFCIV